MADLMARLRAAIRTNGAEPGTGARPDELAAFEDRYGVRLPADVRQYFAQINGLAHGRDDMDGDLIGLWSLADVRPLSEEAPETGVSEPERWFVFGDWSIWCHAYAVRLGAEPDAAAPVIIVWNPGHVQVAGAFAEFLECYILRDGFALYGSGSAEAEQPASRPSA